MALIRPFNGYRYAVPGIDISSLAAPPYDVISEDERKGYVTQDPHNAVALELAEGPLDPSVPANRYETAAARWAQWKEEGVLARDPEPSFYLIEQRFMCEGTMRTRDAVVAEVQLHPFSEGIILPHEATLPKALDDRYYLESATHANFSPIFGLFEGDDDYHGFLDSCKQDDPESIAVDADGIATRMWRLTDPLQCAHIADQLSDRQVFIADGHHRYTVALAIRDEARQARYGIDALQAPDVPEFDSAAGTEFVMMALVDMEDPGLVVMPTHRGIHAHAPISPEQIFKRIEEHFELSDDDGTGLAGCPRPAFFVKVPGKDPVLASLKDDADLDSLIPLDHSIQWKRLDVAVLQTLVIAPIFDIQPGKASSADSIVFSKDADELCAQVDKGAFDAAFLLRSVTMDQLRDVSLSGETMPQKSTYFYPKLPSGFVYRQE